MKFDAAQIWLIVMDATPIPHRWMTYWMRALDENATARLIKFAIMPDLDLSSPIPYQVTGAIAKQLKDARGVAKFCICPGEPDEGETAVVRATAMLLLLRYPTLSRVILSMNDQSMKRVFDIVLTEPEMSWESAMAFLNDGVDAELVRSLVSGQAA
jgi:hypothetical protein